MNNEAFKNDSVTVEDFICDANVHLPKITENLVTVEKYMTDFKEHMIHFEKNNDLTDKKVAIERIRLHNEWIKLRKTFIKLLTIKSETEIRLLQSS
jgi:hypothetical protein